MKALAVLLFEALVDQSIMLHLARMNLVDWTQGPTVGIDDYVGCEVT